MKKKLQQFLFKKDDNNRGKRGYPWCRVPAFILIPAGFVIIIISFSSCTGKEVREKPEAIRFAIIGNTYSETPYSNTGIKIKTVLQHLNEENPVFVIHSGGMACGGKRWSGIKKRDMEQQFYNFFSLTKGIKPIFYSTAGELDFFNGSASVYSKYSGRQLFYSFNYGNIHFAVLNTTDASPGEISKEQTELMIKDLDSYKNCAAIIIFSHHPFFVPQWAKAEPGEFVGKGMDIHRIFLKYPVKAVFSGHLPIFSKQEIDDILYVIAGCGDYDKKYTTKNYQYYIVDFIEEAFNIQAKRI